MRALVLGFSRRILIRKVLARCYADSAQLVSAGIMRETDENVDTLERSRSNRAAGDIRHARAVREAP